MSAGIYNFLVSQGESVQKVFTNLDLNGNVIPILNGTIAQFAVKTTQDINAANIILSRSNETRLAINLAAGTITISLSSSDTENILGVGQFLYDLWLFLPSSNVLKMLTGTITVLGSVMKVIN